MNGFCFWPGTTSFTIQHNALIRYSAFQTPSIKFRVFPERFMTMWTTTKVYLLPDNLQLNSQL